MTNQTAATSVVYDAIAAFQRTHRLPGLQHAQIRGLLAEHLARVLPLAAPAVQAPATDRAAGATAVAASPGRANETAPSVAADQTALRDRIAQALWPLTDWDGDQLNAERAADAVLAVLPAPVDRAAVPAAVPGQADGETAGEGAPGCAHCGGPHSWDDCEAYTALVATDEQPEVVHACPPDGSGLTPCCGRTPFELPLTDRISSEAPVTCPGPEQPAAGAQQPKEARP